MIINYKFSSYNLSYYHIFLILGLGLTIVMVVSIFSPNPSFSQLTNTSQEFQTAKTNVSESFVLPSNDTNADRRNPVEYVFNEPKVNNWIISIYNNLSYYNDNASKTIIKIKEPPPSEKFIELMLFGDQSKRFIVSVNTNDTGYMRMYENNQNGWSTDGPVTVSHANVQGLTVTNGKRIVLDKLGLNGFDVGSIEVYGKDEPSMSNSTFGGSIQFEVLNGNLTESVLYYMPLVMIVGVGGTLIFLLFWKKRN
jgi:hypothetical protein